MRSRFPHGGEVLGAAPANPILAPVLSQDRALSMSRQRDLLDLQAIQRISGLVGYWKADPTYLYEDSAGTTPASLGGVIGNWTSLSSPALQATTANKPILRKTPTTGIYWADSNTSTSALNVALGNLGSACTVARSSAEGVTFTENVSITSTYNIAPAFSFNSDVAIFSRALTATEKALITRYMARAVPMLGNNVVKNGTFDTDTTGWAASPSAALSVVSGRLRITAVSPWTGTSFIASQASLTIGKCYFAKAEARSYGTMNPRLTFNAGPTTGFLGTTNGLIGTLSLTAYATNSALTLITLWSTDADGYADYDTITAQEIL